MNNFIFQNSTKVYFGQGCVKEYLACLTKHAHTILLAYGGGSIKRNGVYDEIMAIFYSAGKQVVEFSGIMANPTYAKVQEGARLARACGADMILAVGGGSVMDCCKAVSLAARYDGDIWDDFWARPGVIDFEPLPLGVIVTVAGTGSECNGGAVITNEGKEDQDRPGLPRPQRTVCPDGPDLHVQRAPGTDGVEQLRHPQPHHGDLFQRPRRGQRLG